MPTTDTRNKRLTLMAVFAHPDDESFGTGGTLAKYGADPEVRVILVCGTRGEAGEISDSKLATPEKLGEVREHELRCACSVLGVDELHFLDYRDSGMMGTVDNINPQALAMADFDEAVGKLVAHIRRERPDVVITFDQSGGYGHPDHIAIHYQTKAAFTAAGDPARYPEQIAAGLAPHRPHKLYFTAIPRRFFESLALKLQDMGLANDPRVQRFLSEPFGLPSEACTTDLEVQGVWEIKYAAWRCHATQLPADSIFTMLPPELMRDLQSWECFQLARSDVGPDDGRHDLFAGLR